MRVLIFFILFSLTMSAQARKFSGQIDFSSNSVTTAYEIVLAIPRRVTGISCIHTSGLDFFVSVGGTQTNCSDAVDDAIMGSNGSFTFDKFPVGNAICIKTESGTAVTGFVTCIGWWDGVAQ